MSRTITAAARVHAGIRFWSALACALMAMAVAIPCPAQNTTSKKQSSEPAAKKPGDSDQVLRHAVFFTFKDDSSADDVDAVVEAFRALPSKIDVIQEFESGKNISPWGLDDGFTHCFLLTFKDEAGRAAYLPHPDHKAFGDSLRPHLDKVFVIDYWGRPRASGQARELKHAAFMKFKDSASDADVRAVEDSLAALPSKIDSIKGFEWGKNNSPEKHDDGFTHCFMFTIDSDDGLEEFVVHPDHQAAVSSLRPALEKARVLDFWTKDDPSGDGEE